MRTGDDGTADGQMIASLAEPRVALSTMTRTEAEAATLAVVERRAGSPSAARDRRRRFISSLGASPAELLVDGRGALVPDHLEAIAHGG